MKIQIKCANNEIKKEYEIGVSLAQIADDIKPCLKYPIHGALVNNKLKELTYQVFHPKTIQFIDITHPIGLRMYIRSLAFLLYKAVKDLYPTSELSIEHTVSKCWFCEIERLPVALDETVIDNIKKRMLELVEADIPFEREELPTEDAIKIFEREELHDKTELFKTRNQLYSSVYKLDNTVNYFYGFLVPSTGYLKWFEIVKYVEGILVRVPKRRNPIELEEVKVEDKLFKIFREHKKWGVILDVPYVGSLNRAVAEKRATDLIKISEAHHEKLISKIAEAIYNKTEIVKLVLIAGPSSSGKTTFSKRLSIQLQVLGYKTVLISLDNYFVNRELTPKDENGEYDYESLRAIDVELFNNNLIDLMNGNEIKVPKFDFASGKQFFNHETLKITNNSLIIVEGIHGLNPGLTPLIDEKLKYKIFVSALTQIAIDKQNPIPTTDNRLIRRIVRDYRYRGYSALDTLRRWESVRRGEDVNIFPYQENADIMFNSALIYELGVFKTFAEPIIKGVPENQPEYAEAVRLLKFFSYFKHISEREIPPTSIIREFLGGSSFVY
ncbi:MAG: nucleoside kinase [Bacteroidota bacterium]